MKNLVANALSSLKVVFNKPAADSTAKNALVRYLHGENIRKDRTIADRDALIAHLESRLETANREANTDPLTGLSNRRDFVATLEQGNDRRAYKGDQILYIDLKKFKAINDTYGHEAGDQALKCAANMMKSKVRESDKVARLGGDEFVVHLSGADAQDAERKVKEIERGFENLFFEFKGQKIQVFGTVGRYVVEEDNMPASEILNKGDVAMYAQKKAPMPALQLAHG